MRSLMLRRKPIWHWRLAFREILIFDFACFAYLLQLAVI